MRTSSVISAKHVAQRGCVCAERAGAIGVTISSLRKSMVCAQPVHPSAPPTPERRAFRWPATHRDTLLFSLDTLTLRVDVGLRGARGPVRSDHEPREPTHARPTDALGRAQRPWLRRAAGRRNRSSSHMTRHGRRGSRGKGAGVTWRPPRFTRRARGSSMTPLVLWLLRVYRYHTLRVNRRTRPPSSRQQTRPESHIVCM
jgi:hypothetical protein